jgi:hypothetical protein
MHIDATRALALYAGGLTAVVGWMMLSAAAPAPASRFDTIDVHRINLRENDGTLRMVIASRDHFPGLILHGHEWAHPGRQDSAGMVFFNDEATENGGLVFGGAKGADGRVVNFGHLSFDQYDQDQVATLEQTEEDGQRVSGLTIADRPDTPIDMAQTEQILRLPPAERDAKLQAKRDGGAFGRNRAFLGKNEAKDALVALRDGDGRVRLRMRVTASGQAAIEFLDAQGKVTRSVGAATS